MDSTERFDGQVAELASLADPVRQRLYRHVAEQRRPVGRDDAGVAVGVSRALAAYHLDRLVDQGLLTARYERLGTRRGPGSGRPTKLYERSARQFDVHLPPRNYELAASLLARAIEDAPSVETRAALRRAAHDLGHQLGTESVAATPDLRPSERRARLLAVMGDCGYEPVVDDDAIRLRNCPFLTLSAEHRDLVCAMNLALVDGLVGGTGLVDVAPVLDPRPCECCVAIPAASATG